MNFTLCVLLVYNDNGSVQTLCITRVSAFCTKCLHRPIVIINQQYTKGEIHFIYLHCPYVFGLCFIKRSLWNSYIYLKTPTVCTVYGSSSARQQPCHHKYEDNFNISWSLIFFNNYSCFQTNLQHNFSEENDERHCTTSPEMRMTSVIRLHSNVTLITPSHV